ncbi:MAG: amidohydrolase [Armatimonadetes bacterium]|nr:amidohydrolase [Armatimonadota bacterium]
MGRSFEGAADTVYVNGRVITVDAAGTVAEALAVKDGKVLAVSDTAEIRQLAGSSTEIVDLAGKTVLPGINDSHCHAADYGSSRPPFNLVVGYPAVKSIADIKEVVRRRAVDSAPGEWIRGIGWDCGYLAECLADRSRTLNRWDLDEAAPHNPVFLVDFTHHRLVANTRALELAGITRDTKTEPGSSIVKDSVSGEPTGEFFELSAQGLLLRAVPPLTRAQTREALVAAMQAMNARGITSLTDGATEPGGVYNDLHDEGALTLRVSVLYLYGTYGAISLHDLEESIPALGVREGVEDEWLRVGGIKIFADGIPQTKTAWLRDEYPEGGFGSLVVPGETDEERREELARMICFAHRSGFQCGIHAVGDRAIEACLDGFVRAQEQDSQRLRHYLIHGDLMSPGDIRRAAANDIGVSTQPILKWVFSHAVDEILGVERSARQFPLRALLDAGVHVSLSSDAPVTDPDWLQGVEAAVLRRSRASGAVSGAEHCVTVAEAIRAYTTGGAWQDHMERLKGSLESGKLADFCVLDQDILSVPPEEIHLLTNVATIVGGKTVHDVGLT